MPENDELDELIKLITVDCYGDEGYDAFLQEFVDEVPFPVPATLAGTPVVVSGVDFDGNARRGLVAILDRGEHPATVSLVDIELAKADQAGSRLIAAYRRWLGVT